MIGVPPLFSLCRAASLTLCVTLLTLALPSVPSRVLAAEAAPATVIIVDSSGSMAAQEADGNARLDAARESIVEALGAWPAGAELAVVAYGHRRTSDCLADRLGIGRFVLVALDVGLHIARWHQPHVVPELH